MSKICIEKTSILQILNLHSSDITCCDFDENFRFASGSSDKKVVICEWEPGKGFVQTPYSPITEYKYSVSKLKFIPKESELITSSADGSISIFNVQNGELLHVLIHVNLASIRTFCYIYENKYLLSAADDGSLCIFDLNRKTLKRSLQLHDDTISVTCASSDSKIILTGDSTGFVKFWHISTFYNDEIGFDLTPELSIPDCHDLGINNAHFSPVADITDRGKEYKIVTGGNDNLLKVWKIICKKRNNTCHHCISELLFSIVGHGSAVTDVKFNFLGNIIVSTSLDKTARLWTLNEYNYQCIKVLKGHKRYVTSCCFSLDGSLLATGSNDKTVIIWDLTGKRTLNSYLQNDIPLNYLSNSPLKKKNLSKIIQKIENLGNAVNSCSFSKDNILAAGGTDKLVRLWHETNKKFTEISISPLLGHQYAVNQVDFSLCGKYLASCSVDGTTAIWNLSEYKQMGAVHSVEGSVKCCKFSPNSEILATAGDSETVCIWGVKDLMLKTNMIGHTDAVSCLSFTSDSKYLVSGCFGGTIRLWCVIPCITICLLCKENVHDLGLTSSDFCLMNYFSTENRYVLVTGGNDSLVKLWDIHIFNELMAKASLIFQLVGHGGDITCVRFAPNSSAIVASTATDKTARIWDTIFGNCLRVLDSKESILTSCSFSFDSSLIATSTLDKAIIIWDIKENVDKFQNSTANGLIKLQTDETNNRNTNEILELLENIKIDLNSYKVPDEFICPITQQLMVEPVLCADGYNYEKAAIHSWFSSGKVTSPLTNEPVSIIKFQRNVKLQDKIKQFVQSLKNIHHNNLI